MSLPPISLYNQSPDEIPGGPAYEWAMTRCPTDGSELRVIVVSPKHLELRIHFLVNRSTACLASGCPYCPNNASRWRAYFAAVNAVRPEQLLMEVPPDAFLPLRPIVLAGESIRGVGLAFRRRNPNVPNSLVVGSLKGRLNKTSVLPEPPDIWAILCRVFRLDVGAPQSSSERPLSQQTMEEADPAFRRPRKPSPRKAAGMEAAESLFPRVAPEPLPGQQELFG